MIAAAFAVTAVVVGTLSGVSTELIAGAIAVIVYVPVSYTHLTLPTKRIV